MRRWQENHVSIPVRCDGKTFAKRVQGEPGTTFVAPAFVEELRQAFGVDLWLDSLHVRGSIPTRTGVEENILKEIEQKV